MTSWVLTIHRDYGNHWDIAKEHLLWDMTKDRQIQQGDVVYFWLSAYGFVGRAEVSQSATELTGSEPLPWTDHGEREYRSRVRFSRVADLASHQVTWTEVMEQAGLPANPSLGHRTDDSAAEAWLTALFRIPDEADEKFADAETGKVEDVVAATGRDTRERTLAEISVRRGQAGFRRKLLQAYTGRCAITGSTTQPVLEAAHIFPYRGTHTNTVGNGLLLRSDIHTLFDLYAVTIVLDEEEYVVRVSPDIEEETYRSLDQRPLAVLPLSRSERPNGQLLREHNQNCLWIGRRSRIDIQR